MDAYSIGQSVILEKGAEKFVAKITGIVKTSTTNLFSAVRYFLVRGELVEASISLIHPNNINSISTLDAKKAAIRWLESRFD
jgi:hypothetical protein